jgi:hypothetical protein
LRTPILRGIGRSLTASDPIERGDVIVVTEWDGEPSLLEAADMVARGVAPRVGLVLEHAKPSDAELIRRGLPPDQIGNYYLRLLRALGVQSVEAIPDPADGTGAEGPVVLKWSEARGFKSLVVISSPDHSRRVQRMFRRLTRNASIKVAVRTTPYAEFNPDRWWETHDGVRTEIEGLGKLLVDVVLHPFS